MPEFGSWTDEFRQGTPHSYTGMNVTACYQIANESIRVLVWYLLNYNLEIQQTKGAIHNHGESHNSVADACSDCRGVDSPTAQNVYGHVLKGFGGPKNPVRTPCEKKG